MHCNCGCVMWCVCVIKYGGGWTGFTSHLLILPPLGTEGLMTDVDASRREGLC